MGDEADWSRIGSLAELDKRDDGGVFGAAPSSSAEGWELVVCQELAVEGKFTFKVQHKCERGGARGWCRLRPCGIFVSVSAVVFTFCV